MGATCAPSYACLHLVWWEKKEVYTDPAFAEHVELWVHYICAGGVERLLGSVY